MQNGSNVYSMDMNKGEDAFTRLGNHLPVNSNNHLSYGIDFDIPSSENCITNISTATVATINCISCSFYENLLYRWNVSI